MAAGLTELEEVTDCSICTELFTDPRVLPCVHTFCLECIRGWSRDKCPGDKLACPLCRKECEIPEDGLGGLPRNVFVGKLKSVSCDMCTYRADSEAADINQATVYCFECRENFCETCANVHRKQKLLRNHKLVQIGVKVTPEALSGQHPPSTCDKHDDNIVKLYCNDCKLAICMICFAMGHKTHKCSDIGEVVDEFRKEITADVTSVVAGVEHCEVMLRKLKTEKNNLLEHVSKSEEDIRAKTSQLKQMLDRHEELLLAELKSIKEKRTREIEAAFEEVERQLAEMESYKTYVCEIIEKGTASDIARSTSGLHDRAAKLMIFDVLERTMSDLGRARVNFSPANFVTDDFSKTIGQLQLHCLGFGEVKTSLPVTVTQTVPRETGVWAVTTVGDHVYLVGGEQQEVEMYDVETTKLQRRLPVPGLSCDASGIAACARNNCLYLSDWSNPSVHRVDLATDVVKQWSVARRPEGLSVNAADNVLVACIERNKIQEYSTDGELLRELVVERPWHAVQLSSGQYVVSQDTTPGKVSVIELDGQVVRRYRPSQASVGPMKYPRSVSVTKHGDILVADQGNSRILAINSSFTRAQELPLPPEVQLQQPCALFLDEPRDRLYIGEFGGSYRLIVLRGLRNICWK